MDLFLLLLIKHAVVDLGIQAQLVGMEKSKYFGNGHIHYFHHGIGTLVIAGLYFPLIPALIIMLFDYIIHWHIDYTKHKVNRFFVIESRTPAWWWTNVIDQCLHFLTYYFIAMYASVLSFLLFW